MNYEDFFSLEIAKMKFDLEELQREDFLSENPTFEKEINVEKAFIKENDGNRPFIKENMPFSNEKEPFKKEKQAFEREGSSNEAFFLLKNVPNQIYGPSEDFLSFVNSRKPTEKDLLKGKKLVFSLEMRDNEEDNGNLIKNILLIAPETSKLIIKEEKRLFILEIEENTLNKALESLLIELL